ncbi:CgeB family protein [Paenibacillus sp. CMAA1364]
MKGKRLTTSKSYQSGYDEGYRYGGCQSILSRLSPPISYSRNLRVLYVNQGFAAIDDGVIEALRILTTECIVTSPELMLQDTWLHHPDVVIVMNALHVFPEDHMEQIMQIKEIGIRTAIWFVDDPYFSDYTVSLALAYDDVFTHELECVSLYYNAGCSRVHYLPLAVNPNKFRPLQVTSEYQYDVCFIGNAFWNRVEIFNQLAPYLQNKKVLIAGGYWERLEERCPLMSPYLRHGWIPVEETVSYYNGAKIVVNIHRTTVAGQDNMNGRNLIGRSINPRTYEISGCGTLQITDIREDLTSYYRPGYDIETFKDVAELQAKIEYYLSHEQERQAMAWRSLWTTHQNHTYIDRVGRMLDTIQNQ